MATIGFMDYVSKYPIATTVAYDSIREHHPDAPFFFCVDGVQNYDNYRALVSHFSNTEWLFNGESLGYPPYNGNQVIEWLFRTFIAVSKLRTDYFMMLEDDCVIINPIQIPSECECYGHTITVGNKIPEIILKEIGEVSGVYPETDYYGAGGGSIFKSSTYLENCGWISKYLSEKWSFYVEHFSPQMGYMDAFMTLYYMLCGKDYTPNLRMINLWPVDTTSTLNEIKMQYTKDYDIIHNYKKFYGE